MRGRLAQNRGSVGPVLLVLLGFMLLVGWTLAGAAASHYLQAVKSARGITAAELAQAGLEAAVGRIDARDPDILAGRPVEMTAAEATGSYGFTVRPSGRGTYIVESVGEAGGTQRGIRAEVAAPPEPFAVLAGGSVEVNYKNLIDLGGTMKVKGDINAHGDVSLTIANAALSVGNLAVEGSVRAGGNVAIAARNDIEKVPLGLLSTAKVRVGGGLAAGGDVRLHTGAGLLLTYSIIEVEGPVTHGGNLTHTKSGLLGFHDVDLNGPVTRGGRPGLPEVEKARGEVAYYEALVADLEEQGVMRHASPGEGCTFSQPTRVTGDLDCFKLSVKDGAVLVVDGSLEAFIADVAGLVYVRGGPVPDSSGDVSIGTLSLLEIIFSLFPTGGAGSLVATGNIDVSGAKLAGLLSFGQGHDGVLQVLALSTGEDDRRNNVYLGLGGLADVAGGRNAAPLFLYAGGEGNVTLLHVDVADAISFQTLPVAIVAGGDVSIDVGGLADAIGTFALEGKAEIWQKVSPFLQGTGRARVLSWEWLE